MLADFIQGISTSGGTGPLTIVADGGAALPSSAIVSGGSCRYAVCQYSDASRTVLLKMESGVGKVTSNVLTRSRPSTTFDGTDYYRSAPSPINFGTSHVVVTITATARGGLRNVNMSVTEAGVNGTEYIGVPSNVVSQYDLPGASLSAGVIYYTPVLMEFESLSQLGVRIYTAASGKVISLSLADIDPIDGGPGRITCEVDGLSAAATGPVFGAVDPSGYCPGHQWACIVSDGSPVVMGAEIFAASHNGLNGLRIGRGIHRSASSYAAFTVGASARAGTTGSWTSASNVPYPIPIVRA